MFSFIFREKCGDRLHVDHRAIPFPVQTAKLRTFRLNYARFRPRNAFIANPNEIKSNAVYAHETISISELFSTVSLTVIRIQNITNFANFNFNLYEIRNSRK